MSIVGRPDGWMGAFRRGMHLLKQFERSDVRTAYVCLDYAIGLQPSAKHETKRSASLNSTSKGLLPVDIVRHVEYERLARGLNMSEMDIALIRASDGFDLKAEPARCGRRQVTDAREAQRYLMAAVAEAVYGNQSASAALLWLVGDRAAKVPRNRRGFLDVLINAMSDGDMPRAVFLGTIVYGSFEEVASKEEESSISASNIAWHCSTGAEGIPRNLNNAIRYYERAIDLDSRNKVAHNNLGQIYCLGDVEHGLIKNGGRAVFYLTKAINAGDGDYAPRNLALLLHEGAPGVPQDTPEAVRLLVGQVLNGSTREIRNSARHSLDRVMLGRKFRMARHRNLSRQAKQLLRGRYVAMNDWEETFDGNAGDTNNMVTTCIPSNEGKRTESSLKPPRGATPRTRQQTLRLSPLGA
jgi:hypothetical protein